MLQVLFAYITAKRKKDPFSHIKSSGYGTKPVERSDSKERDKSPERGKAPEKQASRSRIAAKWSPASVSQHKVTG